MTENTHHIAVLTGDIVNSTALGPQRLSDSIALLHAHAGSLSAWHGGSLHFSRHRGDGWQIAMLKPQLALRTALSLRACLKAQGKDIDTRMACANGTASLPLNADLNTEVASPFINSGLLLQTITQDKDLRLAHTTGGAISAAFVLADYISQDWTPAQAQAIQHALDPVKDLSWTAIAKQIGKSRQATSKAIESAGYPALEIALTSLETGHDDD